MSRIAWTLYDEGDREIPVNVEYAYRPGRPPPRCSDPDDPRFSDPGSPERVLVLRVFDGAGKDRGQAVARAIEKDESFVEAVREHEADWAEAAREEAEEARADERRELNAKRRGR